MQPPSSDDRDTLEQDHDIALAILLGGMPVGYTGEKILTNLKKTTKALVLSEK
jgi:hypothetical protein